MRTIKWDSIKKKAIAEMLRGYYNYQNVGSNEMLAILPALELRMKPRQLLKEWYEEGVNIINRWDVRCAKRLIDCFPNIVPKHCMNQIPLADLNEKGDWMLVYK